MKTYTIAAVIALLAGVTCAAPSTKLRQFEAEITFEGAAGAYFSMFVPTDGSLFAICMSPLCFPFAYLFHINLHEGAKGIP